MAKLEPDPARAPLSDAWPESLVYSGLFQFDVDMNVIPDLTVGLPDISTNGKEYTFTLRNDARFDDGHAVTATDVAFSFRRALSRQEASGPAWRALHDIVDADRVRSGSTRLSGVEVLGKRTVRIRLNHADPRFLLDLALPAASVLEPKIVLHGRHWWKSGGAAGPFRIGSLGSPVVLRPNDHYDEGPLALRTLLLRPASTAARATDLYKRHDLDAAPIPEDQYARSISLPGFFSTDSIGAYYLLPSMAMPSAQRVALAESLDRSFFTSPSSRIDPLYSVVPIPIVPAYQAAADPYQYLPQNARSVLSTSRPVRLEADANSRTSSVYEWVVHAVQAVGLHLKTRGNLWGTLRIVEISSAFPDPQTWLRKVGEAVFHRRNAGFNHLLSVANHAVFSQGLQQEWGADNDAASMLLDDGLVIPIGIQKNGYLISPKVQGLTATPIGLEPSNESWATVTSG